MQTFKNILIVALFIATRALPLAAGNPPVIPPCEQELSGQGWSICDTLDIVSSTRIGLCNECDLKDLPGNFSCELNETSLSQLARLFECLEKLEAKFYFQSAWDNDTESVERYKESADYGRFGLMQSNKNNLARAFWKAYRNTNDEKVRRAFLDVWKKYVLRAMDGPQEFQYFFWEGLNDFKTSSEYVPPELVEKAKGNWIILPHLFKWLLASGRESDCSKALSLQEGTKDALLQLRINLMLEEHKKYKEKRVPAKKYTTALGKAVRDAQLEIKQRTLEENRKSSKNYYYKYYPEFSKAKT